MTKSFQLTTQEHQEQNPSYEEPIAKNVRPLKMMPIPAGSFLMGSPEGELERFSYEGPQHEVTLSPFFMSRYPITQAQWRGVAAMPQVKRALKPDPSQFKGDRLPVEQVSWYEATEFCDRLAVHTHRQYHLPTEAEWEYACRSGTTTPFYFGETITTDLANYCGEDRQIGENDYSGSYSDGPKGEYRQQTTPVDQFDSANAFGLCDMCGNVYEWCQDHWHDNYEGAPTDGSAWLTNDQGARRILRGGSWFNNPRYCRSAYRNDTTPDDRDFYTSFGFRVSCSTLKT